MNAHDWDTVLQWTDWRTRQAKIVEEVKACFDEDKSGESYSTYDVVETLYPEAEARGEAITRRRRIFADLLQKHVLEQLKDYWSRDTSRLKRVGGRKFHPYLWHAPTAKTVKRCPHCNGELT